MARGRNHVRAPRRLTEWAATVGGTAFTALAGATAAIDSSFTTTIVETIVRCRGLFTVQTNQIAAAEQPFGAIGLAIVSDEAFAVGATAVPLPYTDADSDLWLLHQYWAAPMSFADATGFAKLDQQYELDSKAMRRISADETMVLVVEVASVAAIGINYRWDMRILSKVA